MILTNFNPAKKIENSEDYLIYAIEIFESFLQTFSFQNRLLRNVEEGDFVDDGISFIYTSKGERLAEKMQRLLIKLGEKHFPNEEMDISSHYYQQL